MKFPGDPSALLFVGLNQLAPHIGKSFVGQLAIRNVDARSYVARKRAIRVKPWHTNIEEPPVISIVPAQTILHLESLAALEGSLVGIQARLEVLRVHHLCPAVANLRIYGATCEIQPGLIEVRAQFVSPSHPDHHRRGVCDQGNRSSLSRKLCSACLRSEMSTTTPTMRCKLPLSSKNARALLSTHCRPPS